MANRQKHRQEHKDYLGKFDDKGRIYLKSMGFEDGSPVIFVKGEKNDIFLITSKSILGFGIVSGGRAYINDRIVRTIGLEKGDHYYLLRDEFKCSFESDVRLAKAEILER